MAGPLFGEVGGPSVDEGGVAPVCLADGEGEPSAVRGVKHQPHISMPSVSKIGQEIAVDGMVAVLEEHLLALGDKMGQAGDDSAGDAGH